MKTRMWFTVLLLLGSAFPALALQVTRLPLKDHPDLKVTAIAADPLRGKLYVGTGSHDRRNLWVFDTDRTGTPTGKPRIYRDSPEDMSEDFRSTVKEIVFDPQRKRLFLLVGVSGSTPVEYQPLVTYTLDAKGEPQGKPEAFAIGNPHHVCDAIAFHPRLPVLYASGWGEAGVGIFALDATGRPQGAATWHEVGGIGKFSLGVRADGTKLYLGTHPGQLDVCDLDAAGNIDGARRTYQIPGQPENYVKLVATEAAVFVNLHVGAPDSLRYFRLDAKGEPTGEAQTATNIFVEHLAPAADANRALITSPVLFKDKLTGGFGTSGVVVAEIGFDRQAAQPVVFQKTPVMERQLITALGGRPAPAIAVRDVRHKFQGNLFNGLRVRPTLLAAAATNRLPVAIQPVRMPGHDGYLRFAYSKQHDTVYAVSPQGIGRYKLGTAATEFTLQARPGLSEPVAVDDRHGILYAAGANGQLIARSLTADTEETFATGLSQINALAIHPRTGRIYVIGPGGATTNLSDRVTILPSRGVASQALVSPDKDRLYVVTQHPEGDNLAVWTLDAAGRPAASEPRQYNDGLPARVGTQQSLAMAVAVAPQRRLLFVGGGVQAAPPPSVGVAVQTLDENGDPTGAAKFHATSNPHNAVWTLAVAADEQQLFEAGWGSPDVTVWTIDPTGALQPTANKETLPHMGKSVVAVTPERLLVGTNPGTLEIAEFAAVGEFVRGLPATLAGQSLGMLRPGRPGQWHNLDPILRDQLGVKLVRGEFTGATLTNARLQLEFAFEDDRPIRTLTEEYRGNDFAFFAPQTGTVAAEGVAALIESVPERFRHYRRLAEKYAVAPADRPKQFLIANGLIRVDSSAASRTDGLALLQTLGHNTVEIWNWGNRAPEREHGFNRFRLSVYNPPSYYDYNRELVAPAFLDDWTKQFAQKGAVNMGATPAEVALFHLADEPGWYFPHVLHDVTTNAGPLAVFHEYLKAQSLTPEFFGKKNWSEVVPQPLSQATDRPSRRLLYHTARFYTDSFSRGLHAASAALQRRFHPQLLTSINLNNWPGQFFLPSPGKKIGNNPDTGPDAAMGMPDWFALGRHRSCSVFWTEDWFGDADAQLWSLYGDLMRCAAREGDLEYGAYVVGRTTGHFADGGVYKTLALAGHGAKVFDFYTWGPDPAFGDGWSEYEPIYQVVAESVRMLGRGEELLFPGRPRAGTVAILFPQASQVWSPDYKLLPWFSEIYGLHAALIHDQYPVDFIDDTGIENGDLKKYNPHLLFVTAPNLSVKAQRAIAAWVAAGGHLVLLPGAAVADEYNDPVTELTKLHGKPRVTQFADWPGQAYWDSPDRSDKERLPAGWSTTARQRITALARQANAGRPVLVSEPGVEACLLESERGLAVTLLNWTGAPVDSVTVTLPGKTGLTQAQAVRHGKLKVQPTAEGATVTLPLPTVEVLLFPSGTSN